MCMSIPVYLSTYRSIYLSTYISTYRSIYLAICMYVYVYVHVHVHIRAMSMSNSVEVYIDIEVKVEVSIYVYLPITCIMREQKCFFAVSVFEHETAASRSSEAPSLAKSKGFKEPEISEYWKVSAEFIAGWRETQEQ